MRAREDHVPLDDEAGKEQDQLGGHLGDQNGPDHRDEDVEQEDVDHEDRRRQYRVPNGRTPPTGAAPAVGEDPASRRSGPGQRQGSQRSAADGLDAGLDVGGLGPECPEARCSDEDVEPTGVDHARVPFIIGAQ